jgi:hypothetical protein
LTTPQKDSVSISLPELEKITMSSLPILLAETILSLEQQRAMQRNQSQP